jgi:predicted nuclease with TOPRIM domain
MSAPSSSLSKTDTFNPLSSDFIKALSENGEMNPPLTRADLTKVSERIEFLNKEQTKLRQQNKLLKKEVTHLNSKMSKQHEEHIKEIKSAFLALEAFKELNRKLEEDITMLKAAQKQQACKTIVLNNRVEALSPEKGETGSK